MRWKSRSRPTRQDLTCRHKIWTVAGRQWAAMESSLSRKEAGPIESRLLGMGQTMEGKSVSLDGSA